MGKRYVDTALGQVHVTELGAGRPLVLLHQTPWSTVQYARAAPVLATRGFRCLCIDTPGYGASETPSAPPRIEDYADAVVAVLDTIELPSVAIAGFHTGASIAAAVASAYPERISAAALHGVPLYTAEERAQRLAAPHWDQSPAADGSHLTRRWNFIADKIAGGGASPESVQWSVLSFFIAGATEWYGHHAAFSFDMAAALKAIRCPTLILSHTGDSIHPAAARALGLRPDFAYREFTGGTAHFTYDAAEDWAAALAAFFLT